MSIPKDVKDGCGFRSRFSKTNLTADKERMSVCALSVLFWGMAAHAYVFFHNTFSHDSLTEFNAAVFGNEWKMQLGRVFVPVYRFLFRGDINLPWVIGFLSLLFIFGAVYLSAVLFGVKKKRILFFMGGIYSANLTVSATAATFINDLDSNMLALLLSVLSVYLWKKQKNGFVWGILPLGISLGLYQSYISTAIALILISLIVDLLDGKKAAEAFGEGLKGIGMLIGAGILYLICMKLMLLVGSVALKTDNYNSVTGFTSLKLSELPRLFGLGYIRTVYRILAVNASYPQGMIIGLHIVLLIIGGICFIKALMKKSTGGRERILACVLLLLLPIGMNASYVLAGGMSHELMHYAFWLIYLFMLLLVEKENSISRTAAGAVLLVLLWGNVRMANTLYLKKNMEYDANLSFFTRVADRMEQTEGYASGDTPVVFVELPVHLMKDPAGFEMAGSVTGAWKEYVPMGMDRWSYQAYFDYVLLNPAVMADAGTWSDMQSDPRVREMPIYPAAGSLQMIDGVLVVRLGR
ncbi:MAG: glucosyltransferase domain-containing protein [Lachnospiraceae bacterium]|nr:glucosyltransferase domain-containing protein [Lachnospiraceae bacterium]